MNDRKEALAARMSAAFGFTIHITIRSEDRFTFSTDEVCSDLEARVVGFFGPHIELDGETQHDDETGSFVYVRVKGN